MASLIPFRTSDNNYRLRVPIDNIPYLLDVHWNDFEGAWYFDLRQEDETLILANIKIMLGGRIGRFSADPFFQSFIIQVRDTTASGSDAGYDDLGMRVQVVITDGDDTLL